MGLGGRTSMDGGSLEVAKGHKGRQAPKNGAVMIGQLDMLPKGLDSSRREDGLGGRASMDGGSLEVAKWHKGRQAPKNGAVMVGQMDGWPKGLDSSRREDGARRKDQHG
jgi:hypothetical protein